MLLFVIEQFVTTENVRGSIFLVLNLYLKSASNNVFHTCVEGKQNSGISISVKHLELDSPIKIHSYRISRC